MTQRTRLIEQLIDRYELKPVLTSSTAYGWLHGVREDAKAAKIPLAVCDLVQEIYQFLEMPHTPFDHLLKSPITIGQFRQVIYKEDRNHFDKAQQFALIFLSRHRPLDVGRYLLTFEIRLCDSKGQLHNMQLKYWLMGTYAPGQQPALTLRMMAINRAKGSIIPPRTGYIVDMNTQSIVMSFGKQKLTKKEVDVFKELVNWESIQTASDCLQIGYNALKKRRRKALEKTEVESDIKQVTLLDFKSLR